MSKLHLLNLKLRWRSNALLRKLNFSRQHRWGGRMWFEGNNFYQIGFVSGLSWHGGAGYMDPQTHHLGWTAYLAVNSGSRLWQMKFRNRQSWQPVEIGVTRNGNGIPWVSN